MSLGYRHLLLTRAWWEGTNTLDNMARFSTLPLTKIMLLLHLCRKTLAASVERAQAPIRVRSAMQHISRTHHLRMHHWPSWLLINNSMKVDSFELPMVAPSTASFSWRTTPAQRKIAHINIKKAKSKTFWLQMTCRRRLYSNTVSSWQFKSARSPIWLNLSSEIC